jgi:hypothetical protein
MGANIVIFPYTILCFELLKKLECPWRNTGSLNEFQTPIHNRGKYTRVTDMQVCHNVSARHNQLPAKPPCCQQIELTFLWRSLPLANCRIPLWRNDGQVDASIGILLSFMAIIHIAFFYGNMWEPFEPPPAPSGLKTGYSKPVGGASGCIFLKNEGS